MTYLVWKTPHYLLPLHFWKSLLPPGPSSKSRFFWEAIPHYPGGDWSVCTIPYFFAALPTRFLSASPSYRNGGPLSSHDLHTMGWTPQYVLLLSPWTHSATHHPGERGSLLVTCMFEVNIFSFLFSPIPPILTEGNIFSKNCATMEILLKMQQKEMKELESLYPQGSY